MKPDELLELFQKNLETVKEAYLDDKKYLWVTIDRSEIVKAAQFIKDTFEGTQIIFTHAFLTDFPDTEEMEMIYSWWQIEHNLYFSLRTRIPMSDFKIDTITPIWWEANWHEREAWELLGIDVVGHDNLTQLLLPDELMGVYPLRKSFKLRER